MTHLSTFDGLLGFATLHPVLTLGPVLIAVLAAVVAGRRRSAPNALRRRN
jgi:hypothetical protein